MAKKYYAVANGREGTGIYTEWAQAEKNVSGVSGVRYKAFPDEGGARRFLAGLGADPRTIRLFGQMEKKERQEERPEEKAPRRAEFDLTGAEPSGADVPAAGKTMYAYVDGSFRQGYAVYGYGVVIVSQGQVIKTFSGTGERPEYVSMRNVAGEVLGAVRAMQYALRSGAEELILYFDYQGIESWAKGSWKRNNGLTKGYHEFVASLEGRLRISFHKVKGHSGDQFNDLADELAKQAVISSRDDAASD